MIDLIGLSYKDADNILEGSSYLIKNPEKREKFKPVLQKQIALQEQVLINADIPTKRNPKPTPESVPDKSAK